jgi:site-specific DNA-methyltransferase (adenine-specific)
MNAAPPLALHEPEIWQGDALATLDLFPDESFDCVIADPPYGATQNVWDSPFDLSRLWPALTRVCRGAIVLTATQPYAATLICSQPRWFRHEWIWAKNKGSNHLNCKRAPLRYHENILVFSADSLTYNPQMTAGHKPGNHAVRRTLTPNYGAQREAEPYGGQTTRYPRSIQAFDILNNDSPERFHPTQKPVELMRYLVRTYSNPGDHILDFCAGAGTTGLAARAEGRRSTLIELSSAYCDIIRKRLA